VFLGEDTPSVRAIASVASSGITDNPVQFVFDPYDQMTIKADTDFASKTANYDVVLQYNTALASYVRNKYIIPLSEFPDRHWVDELAQELFPQAWKEVGWYQASTQQKPEPFGVPFSANSMVLCCNRALFEDASNRRRYEAQSRAELRPPRTWEELEAIAKFFSAADSRGIALQGADSWNYWEWANFAFGHGGGVMSKQYGWISDENTPLILSSQSTVDATERYLRLKNYSQYGQSGADFFSTDAAQQIELMKSGQYAMAIMWSDVVYNLVHGRQSWSSAYSFHTIPGSVSMLAGGSYYINRQTNARERVFSVIKQLFAFEQQKKMALLGLCPPRKEIYSDEALKREIPYLAAVGESLQRGVYMLEAGPDADDVMQILSRILQELFHADTVNVAGRLSAGQAEIAERRNEMFKNISRRQ
jgi:multiple sugar transport system substrate-binding protein